MFKRPKLCQLSIKSSVDKSIQLIRMCVCACSVMSVSQPTSLLCPWDFPGKNTGVCCHFLLQGINPETEPESPASPALAGGFFTTEPPGKPLIHMGYSKFSVFCRKQLPRSIPDPRPSTSKSGTQGHALGGLSWV